MEDRVKEIEARNDRVRRQDEAIWYGIFVGALVFAAVFALN